MLYSRVDEVADRDALTLALAVTVKELPNLTMP